MPPEIKTIGEIRMSLKDLRGFMNFLERENELIKIKKEVNTKFEIAAFIRKSSDIQGPALLFENVKGYRMPVAGGIYATRKRIAMALGSNGKNVLKEYMKMEQNPINPKLVKDGPVKEVIITGKGIDLRKLPIVWHSEKDVGPYIAAGVQIGKDPDTGVRNASMYRMLLLNRNTLTLGAPIGRHLMRFISKAEDNGKPLEIATAIGTDPYVVIGSQARVPMGVDELSIAGGLQGKPIEIVKCETIDVEVPATAEIVIEGETIPKMRKPDGPFGEYQGTYSGAVDHPVVKVKAITMRKNAIYQTCLTGMPLTENHTLIELPAAALAYKEVQKICPEIKDVNITPGGTSRHHAIVSIKKRHDAEGRNALLSLLATPIGIKLAIVVDDDINIFNPLDVEWAVNTRVQPDKDVIIIPNMWSAGALDPSAPKPQTTSKMGIDATIPMDEPREKYEKVRVPGTDEIDLKRYLTR